MVRPLLMLRTLTALFLLAAITLIGIRLGYWQLDRASQRDAIKTAIDSGRASQALELSALTPPDQLTPWRSASASGVWLHEYTVLLDNRSLAGRPGYWVATPLLLSTNTDGHAPKRAVLVLRGWLALPKQVGTAVADIPSPAGPQAVQGELLERVPRLFELWSWSDNTQAQLPSVLPDPTQALPIVQNLDLTALAAAADISLLPTVLAASPDSASGLQQQWPDPSLDSDKNRGYALQWFGFAAIAAIAWLVIAWRALRRYRKNV